MKSSRKHVLANILAVLAALSLSVICSAQAPASKVAPKKGATKELSVKKEAPAPKKGVVAEKKTEEAQKTATEVAPTPTPTPKPNVYGWKEWVWVVKPEVIVRAKLDTGAQTCSIHATNIEKIEIDGKQWVKFTISDPQNEKSARVRYKAPLLRISKIKNDTGGLDERLVVPLTFQIGDRKLVGEFNLNDRSKMVCAMLIGRNILKEIGYVDSEHIDLLGKPKRSVPKKSATPTKSVK